MHAESLSLAIILLTAAVLCVALFQRLRLPAILAYLCVGTLLGPNALGWFDVGHEAHLLGEIGIAFLLFAIGLEFSLPQFWTMRTILLGLGGFQVLVGTLSGAIIAAWIGIPWAAAVIVGGALAMSSTAIVVKQLTDQVELQQTHGRLALGILLFQDLAAVPFLVLIPLLATQTEQNLALTLLLMLAKAVLAIAVLLACGRYLLRPLFHEVARARSAELFTLTVLLVCLLAAWFTSELGLSLALGAFLIGMMLSETEYRHQIEMDIRPFRDVLLGLFFVMVGMQLDLALLPPLWFWIALLVVGLIIGKGLLIAGLTLISGYPPRVALRTGMTLAHGGEFGFALLALALQTGLLTSSQSQPIIAAVIITMLIAPLLIRHNKSLSQRLLPQTGSAETAINTSALANNHQQNHVIICGYGRVGRNTAELIKSEGIEYLALDLDPHVLKEAWQDKKPVYYGDASRRDILLVAGLEQARAVLICIDTPTASLKIVQHIRALRADIPIIVRAKDDSQLAELRRQGATEIVPETLEASLMLVTQLLLVLDVPIENITDNIQTAHRTRTHL